LKYINNIYFKLFISLLVVIYIVVQAKSGGDFKTYLGAANLLKNGESCYFVRIPYKDGFSSYSYSPFFAILLIPFTYLPQPIPQLFWLSLNVFFLYRIFKIIKHLLDVNQKDFEIWFFITFLLSIRFILHNFELIQMTIFLVYCFFDSVFQNI